MIVWAAEEKYDTDKMRKVGKEFYQRKDAVNAVKDGLPWYVEATRFNFHMNISRHWQGGGKAHEDFPWELGVRNFLRWRFEHTMNKGLLGVIGPTKLAVIARLAGYPVLHYGLDEDEEQEAKAALSTVSYLMDETNDAFFEGYPTVVKHAIIADYSTDAAEAPESCFNALTFLHAQTTCQDERFFREKGAFKHSLKPLQIVPGAVIPHSPLPSLCAAHEIKCVLAFPFLLIAVITRMLLFCRCRGPSCRRRTWTACTCLGPSQRPISKRGPSLLVELDSSGTKLIHSARWVAPKKA